MTPGECHRCRQSGAGYVRLLIKPRYFDILAGTHAYLGEMAQGMCIDLYRRKEIRTRLTGNVNRSAYARGVLGRTLRDRTRNLILGGCHAAGAAGESPRSICNVSD